MQATSIDIALLSLLSTSNIFFMLCCKDIFLYVLVLDVGKFYRLCSQTRFIMNQKEIDVKSVYLNLETDKVADLPGFHTFSGEDIKGPFLSNGKKMLVIFNKETKLSIKHLRIL